MTSLGLDPTAHRLRLALCGEIDVATVDDAFTKVLEVQPVPGDVVTLDMSEVTFIDSTGLALLLQVGEYLGGMESQLALANPSAPVMRLLTLVNLTEHVPIESD